MTQVQQTLPSSHRFLTGIARYCQRSLPTGLALAVGTALALCATAPQAQALETIKLNYGSMFTLDLPLSEVEAFAKTGQASDNLQLLLDLGKVDRVTAQSLLNNELNLDSRLTNRALESYLGELLLKEMGSVVQAPAGTEAWKDIRSAVMASTSDQKLTALEVLKAYKPSMLSINGEKAMGIVGRLVSDFSDIKQILGFQSLKDLTGAVCPPK